MSQNHHSIFMTLYYIQYINFDGGKLVMHLGIHPSIQQPATLPAFVHQQSSFDNYSQEFSFIF